jgi:hypothetical protein
VLIISETISKNPKAPTNPKLTARARIKRDTVVVCGFAFQIAFKAACISPNTPDAVAIKTAMPIIVAMMPEDFSAALAMADCKTSAVWRPIRSLNCEVMAF